MGDTPERLCVDQHPTLGSEDDLQVLTFPMHVLQGSGTTCLQCNWTVSARDNE